MAATQPRLTTMPTDTSAPLVNPRLAISLSITSAAATWRSRHRA